MAVFSYRATTMEGAVVEGVIEAPSEDVAIDRLRNSRRHPLKSHCATAIRYQKDQLQVEKAGPPELYHRTFRPYQCGAAPRPQSQYHG